MPPVGYGRVLLNEDKEQEMIRTDYNERSEYWKSKAIPTISAYHYPGSGFGLADDHLYARRTGCNNHVHTDEGILFPDDGDKELEEVGDCIAFHNRGTGDFRTAYRSYRSFVIPKVL